MSRPAKHFGASRMAGIKARCVWVQRDPLPAAEEYLPVDRGRSMVAPANVTNL